MMKSEMWSVSDVDGKLFLRVYGNREAVDIALKTWWDYYHARGGVTDEFVIWRQRLMVIVE